MFEENIAFFNANTKGHKQCGCHGVTALHRLARAVGLSYHGSRNYSFAHCECCYSGFLNLQIRKNGFKNKANFYYIYYYSTSIITQRDEPNAPTGLRIGHER